MSNRTYQELQSSYMDKRALIKARLKEFKQVFEQGDDRRIFEELVFCIFTANASAKMGLKAVDAVRDILMDADTEDLSSRLQHVHRFPNARARYIVHTREFLKKEFNFRLKDLILSFSDRLERRDFFANHKDIKGVGFKESSHFLRNIGFRGYAILDKHILQSLYEFGVIDNPNPPVIRDKYLQIENKFNEFANKLEIDSDELDLLLWSEKTGEILK
ncbi:MAG TPA: N-glycosylase/DNA lyase [Thermodesulfobacteriota bacterium]|nr:N-glycosylase/DNA lyase [Thermodesulfobacteriota bacterium]